jgi:FdhD protein
LNGTQKDTQSHHVIRYDKGVCLPGSHELIGEEPLLIRVDGKPYSVVMRTPGDEIFHAAGFCLGEGIADSPDDFNTVGYCKDLDPNVIDVRLTPARHDSVHDILERRGFVSQTSCGICGKELVKDLYQILSPSKDCFRVDIQSLFNCINKLSETQMYYQSTKGSHAAMIFDNKLSMIAFAEDVGRHNALDKATGKVLLNKRLGDAAILILSSRVSYELVQKAARAHLQIIVSNSRPTALAAEMGDALNMTLACTDKECELIIICGENRIIF